MVIPSLLVVALSLVFIRGQAPGSQPTEPNSAGKHVRETELGGLIHDLASISYTKREAATNTLMDTGPWAYSALQEAFTRDPNFEVRRRIKQIAFEIYLSDQIGPPRAFLGISQGRLGMVRNEEPRVPAGAVALVIQDVFTGCAAEAAGIRRGDLIFTLDGKLGKVEIPPIQLTDQIGRKRPGDVIQLGVFRGGIGLFFQDGETAGFRIRDLAGIRKKLVRREDDPRVLPGAAAFRIDDVGEKKAHTPLKAGDLLVALDGEPVSPTKADEQFQQWIETHSTPAVTQIQQLPLPLPVQPGQVIRRQGPGTAQVLRGGQWLELRAQLGRWPFYLNSQFFWGRNIDATTAAAVQGAFDDWWRANFDPRGQFSERADNDPNWKFAPGGAGD